jgi:hypothetical protein
VIMTWADGTMDELERRGPVGFVLAGTLSLATVGYGGFGEVAGLWTVIWPLVVVGFGGMLLAGVIGLLGLYPALGQLASGLAAVAGAAAVIAGLAATSWIVTGALGMSPWELPESFASLVLLGGLGAFLASFLLFGVGILRTGSHPRSVGALLAFAGLSFVAPLADEVLGWHPPEWLPVGMFGLWGVVLIGVGILLRTTGRSRSGIRVPSRV